MAINCARSIKKGRPFILGITPARGGSKGIPKKNIKCIAGKPLIAWTIEAARASKLLNKYVVSTENAGIAAFARKYKAQVLQRPVGLSTDTAPTIKVLQHAVKVLPCDIVVLLQATSPIRRKGLIDSCIREFLSKDYDSMATGFLCKYTEYGKNNLRRQDINGFFSDDGNVYVIKADLIKRGKLFGKNTGRRVISRIENVDIDNDFDFNLAENILKSKKPSLDRYL